MIEFDPASFKDPAGRVFYHQGWVCRTLTEAALSHYMAAVDAGLIGALVADRLIVPTESAPASELDLPSSEAGAVVLRQPGVPVVTYPYEWSFEMLRDAALVTLRIIDRALASGFVLKDATSFNILFDGNVPKLVDVPSIEPYREGDTWAGYGQFCRCFLFPLLLSSYRDIDLQALLRGTFGEVPVQEAAKHLHFRDYARPGVIKDIVLQARLDRGFARSGSAVKSVASGTRYPRAMLVANVRRLVKVIEGLKAPVRSSEWASYDTIHTYTDADRAAKTAFVGRVLDARRFGTVADLGCNTGDYSQQALRSGARVVSLDLDSGAIDRLYRGLLEPVTLSPVVASLLNPTPAMGWNLRERRSLFERIGSDGFLALALVHHLRITGGVPTAAIVSQLFAIAPEGIVEWVDKADGMVQAMLALRPDVYDDYTVQHFESAIRARGEIVASATTHGGKRRLYHVRAGATTVISNGRAAGENHEASGRRGSLAPR